MTWVSRFSGICDLLPLSGTLSVQFHELKDFVRYCEQLLCLAEDITVLKTNLKRKSKHQESVVLCSPQQGEPGMKVPEIRHTVINIVNRGLHEMPSECLRTERVTALEERKDLQQYSGLIGKWVENVIPHRRVVREVWELHVSE